MDPGSDSLKIYMVFTLKNDPISVQKGLRRRAQINYQGNHSNSIFFRDMIQCYPIRAPFRYFSINISIFSLSLYSINIFPSFTLLTPFNHISSAILFPAKCLKKYFTFIISTVTFLIYYSAFAVWSLFFSALKRWIGQNHLLSDSKYYAYLNFYYTVLIVIADSTCIT